MKILIVEDDQKNRDFLERGLAQEGYSVDTAADGDTAIHSFSENTYDLIILDVMLPGRTGLEVLRELRKHRKNTPVIILSAKQNSGDKIEGLKLGADDYLSKPYSFAELMARIEALLRRSHTPTADLILKFESISLNPATRTVEVGDQRLELPNKEFLLLNLLIRNPGRVLSKTYILDQVWNIDFDPQTGVVDVLVSRLRSKLEPLLKQNFIHTVRGAGYVLKKD